MNLLLTCCGLIAEPRLPMQGRYRISGIDERLTVIDRANRVGRRMALALVAGCLAACPRPSHAAAGQQERILVVGDSQAQGLAAGLQRLYRSDRSRRVVDLAKVSTGLMPRANMDWPAHVKTIVAEGHYDVAVMFIGANDRPLVHVGGHVDDARMANFSEGYCSKVTSIAETFKTASIPLIWVGHPVVRDAVWNEDVSILDNIFTACAPAGGATYFSTAEMFRTPDGAFEQYGKGLDGVTTRLRLDDGVHLTPAGYDILAAALAPLLDQYRQDDARPPGPQAAGDASHDTPKPATP